MRKLLIFFIAAFFSKDIYTQNYIYDVSNNKPIQSAHILYDETKGLITNEDGFFELENNIKIDSLEISHLSYKTKKIYSKILKPNDTIFLTLNSISLDEVNLTSLNPIKIVENAIDKIDSNYLDSPYNLFGFFRQSLQEDQKGIEMIEVDFISFIKNNTSQYSTKITSARRTENYSEFGIETYGGASAVIENGDFVRRKSYFLDKDNINNYKFEYVGVIKQNNSKVYKINFSPLDNNDLIFLRQGTLYIEAETLAIVEIYYKFDKNKLARISEQSEININKNKPFYRLLEVENRIKYRKLPKSKKWTIYFIEAKNLRQGIFKNQSHLYELNARLVTNNVKIKNPVKVRTNYNLSKNFSKAVKKFENLKDWTDTYKFSLSKNEKRILNEINQKSKI